MKFHISLAAALMLLFFSPGVTGAAEKPESPSGAILMNHAVSLAQLERLDGSGTSTPVTLARWRQAVFELERSAVTDLGWPGSRELTRKVLSQSEKNEIPLALVNASYLQMGPQQTLTAARVFAFAPQRARTYYGGNVRFSIDVQNMLQKDAQVVQKLRFDAGDGLGYRPLAPGADIEVHYAQTGLKDLRLQATLADGSTVQSSAQLDVVQLATPDPTTTWPITASQAWDGIAGTGQAYVYLAEGHAEVTNPVVVVEGFDIDNSIDWPVLYDLLNRENLLEDLRAQGYDAVVLDFTEAVDPIERNAFVLTELIQMVNAATPQDQTSVLIGASMGGLVARYGLLWMEQQNIPHEVRTYISFDSPHEGANIPLGIQEWVQFFSGEAAEAAYLVERLYAPAARQMLLYHAGSTSGTTANPDPALVALDAELTSLGDWPQTPRTVSIVNGSGSMQHQGFNAGDQVIDYVYTEFPADITGNVWAVPDGGSQLIFEGLIDPIIGSSSSEMLTIAGSLPWDNAPGGSRATMDELASATAPYGDILALHGSHCFIPTISSLAVASNDPFYDIAGDADLPEHTPFDQVYFPAENQEHIAVTAENKAWFLYEINDQSNGPVIFSDGFEGGAP